MILPKKYFCSFVNFCPGNKITRNENLRLWAEICKARKIELHDVTIFTVVGVNYSLRVFHPLAPEASDDMAEESSAEEIAASLVKNHDMGSWRGAGRSKSSREQLTSQSSWCTYTYIETLLFCLVAVYLCAPAWIGTTIMLSARCDWRLLLPCLGSVCVCVCVCVCVPVWIYQVALQGLVIRSRSECRSCTYR